MEISTKFAYLPNGIIRNIIAYTGTTYKKRNGKYMGQIPKNDIRYMLLLTIPLCGSTTNSEGCFAPGRVWTGYYQDRPTYEYFQCSVNLTRINDPTDRFDLNPSVYMTVWGIKYTNDPLIGNLETINYDVKICDWKGNQSNESFEYYRYDEKYDKFLAEMAYCKRLIKKTFILAFMFVVDFIIQECCS